MPPLIAQHRLELWQGPYPPPEAVERYEKISPGTFNRLITMAENLQNAQIEQSADALRKTHNDIRRCPSILGCGFARLLESQPGEHVQVINDRSKPYIRMKMLEAAPSSVYSDKHVSSEKCSLRCLAADRGACDIPLGVTQVLPGWQGSDGDNG